MEPSVASITTTYNGKRFLGRHIDSLLAQSRPLREIVIIDNGSTDETAAFLAERYPQVTVLRLEVNVGAAGGWAAGMSYAALKPEHDWIWNFDDDSVAPTDALEKILSGADTLAEPDEVGILAPLPVHPETGFPYYPQILRNGAAAEAPAEMVRQPIWFADLVIASGCMVRRQVVERIGLPLTSFYMDFFDFEYSLRARSAGYRIAVISDCRVAHEIGNTRSVRLLGKEQIWIQQPPWREYYIARNLIYTAWRLRDRGVTRLAAAKNLLRHAITAFLVGERKIATSLKIVQGAWDGVQGRLGIRFRPQNYMR